MKVQKSNASKGQRQTRRARQRDTTKTQREIWAVEDTMHAMGHNEHDEEYHHERDRNRYRHGKVGTKNMTANEKAVCLQVFDPHGARNVIYPVFPSKLKGIVEGNASAPLQKGEKWFIDTSITAVASAAGWAHMLLNLGGIGFKYNSANPNTEFVRSDGNPIAVNPNALQPAVVAGIIPEFLAQRLARPPSAIRGGVIATLLGCRVAVVSQSAEPLYPKGKSILTWLPDPINPATGAYYTFLDLKKLGYRVHNVSSISASNPVWVTMPAGALQSNDRITTEYPFSNYGDGNRTGIIVFIASDVQTQNQFTLKVDCGGFWHGQEVSLTTGVVYDDSAYNCAKTCETNAGLRARAQDNESGSKTGKLLGVWSSLYAAMSSRMPSAQSVGSTLMAMLGQSVKNLF